MKNFEDFLTSRNDEIDNAAYDLLNILACEKDIDWNMAYIGEVWEAAKAELKNTGIDFCHPYYVNDDIPCYKAGDCNCETCLFTESPLIRLIRPFETKTRQQILSGKREIRRGDFALERDAADWSDDKGLWNYQLSTCCNVDEIFGTNVETSDNNDYINVYVDVASDYGSIESDLYVILCKEDGTDVEYERKLSDMEKDILLEMIQAYEIKRLDELLKERDIKKNLCQNSN